MAAVIDILDAAQVAEILGCSPRTVQEKARAGVLPAIKYGDDWRYPREALLRALNEQALANMAPKSPRAVAVATPGKARRRLPALVGDI